MRLTVAVLLPLLGFLTACYALEETQTDWSGGWGVQGPESYWTSSFLSYDRTDYSASGALSLSRVPGVFEIDSIGVSTQVLVDMDQDGDVDIITFFPDYGLCWLENIDNGTEWIRHRIDPSYASSICPGDINNDGYIDVVICWDEPGAEIVWLENPGTDAPPPWQMHIIDPYGYPSYLKVADVDSDGDMDVLGTSYDSGVAWWVNFSQGSYWSKQVIDNDYSYPTDVTVLDLYLPSFVCYRSLYPLSVYQLVAFSFQVSGWHWHETIIFEGEKRAPVAQPGDINSDGLIDLVAYEGYDWEDKELVWYQQISYNDWERHVIHSENSGLPGLFIGVADLDGDGDDDVYGIRRGTNALPELSGIWWWENNGTGSAWNMHHVAWGFSGSKIGSADINLDGSQDLVTNIHFPYSSSWVGIKWWDLTAENEYHDEGELVSSVLDTGDEPSWQYIDWNLAPIPFTSVAFQVRGGNSIDAMGEWSESITSPMTSLGGYLEDGDRYIQYRAILSTSNEMLSPVLQDVSFHYWPVSIEEAQSSEIPEYGLQVSGPNPSCSGTVGMSFSIPALSQVQLDVFDVSGRVIRRLADGEFTPGDHSFEVTGLSTGIYLCRMQSGSFSDSVRFVILD